MEILGVKEEMKAASRSKKRLEKPWITIGRICTLTTHLRELELQISKKKTERECKSTPQFFPLNIKHEC